VIHSGLCSITFRQLSAQDLLALVSRAGLDGIEWGGDLHVPHGDLKCAREIGRQTREAGLKVSSYGSYYRLISSEADGLPFEQVLETAVVLGAPCIRVWAGSCGSDQATPAIREQVAAETRRILSLAEKANVAVAYEYHGGTLADTNESALALLQQVEGVQTYWQPPVGTSLEYRLDGLRQLLPRVSHLHVFQWLKETGKDAQRLPLASGRQEWLSYLNTAASEPRDRFALLEFVRDNDPEQFLEDASTLKAWLRDVNVQCEVPAK
jgi:sugar phosphate isomerase/epimerase